MGESSMDRRRFNELTAAALGGLAAGAVVGCGGDQGATDPGKSGESKGTAVAEAHLCRGLNECKGKGKGGDNACRGQGACATAKEHTCGGMNECKGLGGCGENVGANDCKGKGGCHVPLMDTAWDKLRKKKEGEWQGKKSEFGEAPAKS